MDKLRLLTLAPICVLASCGQPADDPSTIPVSGKWVHEGKLTSFSVNGMSIDPSKVPQMDQLLAEYNRPTELCGEPPDLNEQEFQEKMGSDKFANCTIDSRTVNGNRISETASCDAVNLPGVSERVKFTSKAVLRPDKVIAEGSFIINGQNPNTGARTQMKIEMEGTMTRLGDC